ncbi:fumarylacetoacetate hydrolase family protein [Marinisporobacter balticus]|uniref:2-keto-4-pentenoate hydratase/2-oxohepta-3-ene-1,7-dioic acid hydratase in catechol pathway n=1 Tax=Marinisporobacter balticus TaxID=2018667 RepID=A0A4R2KZN4_9FIRM|nr:fumarylacetoacetate hydrolase family protein [Marinisporobacter balticus]TCO79403.1 2-keto-4-pentenoate hydratase/2-oxohepta-3-ene-1,7-dioic acid hydratase in catechol pathway [Marinisporobacter balticus]
MYFATFAYNNIEQTGILSKDQEVIIPMKEIFNKLNKEAPQTLKEFVETSDDHLIQSIKDILEISDFEGIPVDQIKLCAPIPYPSRNLICLGKNYIDHAKEVVGLPGANDEIPKFPIYFSKIAHPAIGHQDMIKNHKALTDMIDYEVELAVVIGRDGINIKIEEVEEYIFGYTIVNDVSARNLQRKHEQWFRGKCLETFCPMGPYLVHKSEIPFPVTLDLKCSINGEIRQNSNTENLIFDIPYIISDLSKGMYLRTGDIIITGTPSGVGLGFKPFKFLKSGDVVECYIEKIGTLTNTVE